jgi:uncharacterized membrane protein YfcA
MPAFPLDSATFAIVLAGALFAGFTTGFAGFGTGLVASGFWLHALPASQVPPLVVLAGIAGQIVGLTAVRKAFDWRRAAPYLVGGLLGVPLGVAALSAASPDMLRGSIGAFLVAYATYQVVGRRGVGIGNLGGRWADGMVGAGGGFLSGFAGLPGPLPLIWLQLRGGPPDVQRATYQPFNFVVLAISCAGMIAGGQINGPVFATAVLCLPATLLGASIGARAYGRVSPEVFRRVVLGLLLASGVLLLAQALFR